MNNNVVAHNFKNYNKTSSAKRKRRIKMLAILGSFLILSSLLGSLICYFL